MEVVVVVVVPSRFVVSIRGKAMLEKSRSQLEFVEQDSVIWRQAESRSRGFGWNLDGVNFVEGR